MILYQVRLLQSHLMLSSMMSFMMMIYELLVSTKVRNCHMQHIVASGILSSFIEKMYKSFYTISIFLSFNEYPEFRLLKLVHIY